MPINRFIWCDLSTFDMAKASLFYANVFGWSSHPLEDDRRGDDYTLLCAGSDSAAGMYTMPEFFQSINMPSFWMSYVQVESLEHTVGLAVELGAKCEIEPTPFDEEGRFALIRDPAGAGFTLYEGPDLLGRHPKHKHGRMVWNELHVPSADVAERFYGQLFGWRFVADPTLNYRHLIQLPDGAPFASLLELDEQTKGPKNYWAVLFAVDDLATAQQAVTESGGSVLLPPSAELDFVMATDDLGAMFCLLGKSSRYNRAGD